MTEPTEEQPQEQKPLPAAKSAKSASFAEISPQALQNMFEVQKLRAQNEAASFAFKEKELAKYSLYPISGGGGYWLGRKAQQPHDPKLNSASKIVDDADIVN